MAPICPVLPTVTSMNASPARSPMRLSAGQAGARSFFRPFPSAPVEPMKSVRSISFQVPIPCAQPRCRAVFMDLATELGEQGFRWIFVIHLHGAPNHNRILDQVCAYFNDMYQGRMVNLASLIMSSLDDVGYMSEEDQKAAGLDVHAGTSETSWMLFVQPDLVDPAHKEAVSQSGANMDALIRIAQAPNWPGYFGSPAHAQSVLRQNHCGASR